MIPDCSAVFLAGGQSSRMGSPKAWLEFAGRPLLAHLVERMSALFADAVVVAAPGQELPPTSARVVRDERPGEGPVAGLVVGLREVSTPLAFVASCDVPFLDPAIARLLVETARTCDAAVPEWEGRLQPLQAVYRTSVQPLLVQQLEEGRRRPVDLFDRVRTVIIPETTLRAIDPEGRSFLNMNTPEDYERAKERWAEWAGPYT